MSDAVSPTTAGGAATPSASPIADVSYRGYDGPLLVHRFRWWIIARMAWRLAFRKRGIWVMAALALLPYLIAGFQLYIRSRVPSGLEELIGKRPFGSYFYDAFSQGQLWLFLLALTVGAGSIAGDNRTNALQIYLSKPITKGDYLIGKWFGIFSMVAVVALVPALVLYLFCLASFHSEGFLSKQPDLLLRLLGTCLLPALIHASLLVGFSAWFKRPVLAGGIYAGVYFGMQVVAGIIAVILVQSGGRTPESLELFTTLTHLSIPGVARGVGQHLYNATPTFFGMPQRGPATGRPELWPLSVLAIAMVTVGFAAARARIRAVEVVKG